MLARACVLFGALLILPGAMANAQTGLGSRPLIRRPVTQTPPAGQPPAALSMTERTNWVRRFLHREVTLEPLTLRFSLGSRPAGARFSAVDVTGFDLPPEANLPGSLGLRQNGSVAMTVPTTRQGRYVFDCHVLSSFGGGGTWQWRSNNGQGGTTLESEHHVLFVVDLAPNSNEVSLQWLGGSGSGATFFECDTNRLN